MILIGFGHKARQGKNTAALAVLEWFPLDADVVLCAYADALRKEVDRACRQYGGAEHFIAAWKEAGVMPAWVHNEIGKQRTLYQWYGTDYRRAQDKDYWIKQLFNRLDKSAHEAALITDVRFPNECEGIKKRGGYVVKVTRTTKPDFEVPEHPSEQALDGYTDWDYELKAASVPELKEKAKALYYEIARRQPARCDGKNINCDCHLDRWADDGGRAD